MRDIGVDIVTVGLITLAQAPWTFKVLWSPLMDRFVPPFWGRRRGWMAVTQVALFACTLMLAGVGSRPESIGVVGALALAIALASASQDIAIDAYAVEVLHRDEQGAAAGARTAAYRVAMLVSGGAAISLAARMGWPAVNVLLAAIYLPILLVTWRSPEPDVQPTPPPSLREAVWQPFLRFLTRPRAIQILAFVVLYKLADQLAQALTRPFLIDMGYGADQRGIALATIGVFATVGGAFIGGWVTTLAGLGHALWIFGFLQLFSNIGYFLLSVLDGPNDLAMYGATSFELLTSGMGTGAFAVLLLRLTEKRFSATQYALFSSLFALPRVLSGPASGFAVDALGWPLFYLLTLVVGIPGLVMLARFVPLGVREPDIERDALPAAEPAASLTTLALQGVAFATLLVGAAGVLMASLDALEVRRATPDAGFDLAAALMRVVQPMDVGGWLQLAGIVTFAVIGGIFIAAARVRNQ
jgi:PAT family beta-lactamase induction signal transducer AmpG